MLTMRLMLPLSLTLILFLVMVSWIGKLKRKDIVKGVMLGVFAAVADFVVEYFGTSAGKWTYHESLYFIFDKIPIELVFMFFAAGFLLAIIVHFVERKNIRIPLRSNMMFYILMLVTFSLYVRELYMHETSNLLPFAIVVGLWGISNISEKNKQSAIALALTAFILDFVLEILIIGSGGYDYQTGFTVFIPMIYALITLGVLALLEKIDKLSGFLDSVVISSILKLFGIYRKKAKKKIKHIKNRAKKMIK